MRLFPIPGVIACQLTPAAPIDVFSLLHVITLGRSSEGHPNLVLDGHGVVVFVGREDTSVRSYTCTYT